MLKRTKGLLLLTLLVITGFAGTLNTSSLSKKERKLVVSQLKNSKADVLKNIKALSEKQLNFKSSPGEWSIKEHLYHVTKAESGFWTILENSMKQPANPEKRCEIKLTDENMMMDVSLADKACEAQFQPAKAGWKSVNEAAAIFKSLRSQQLKYVKTTTEDLRNHLVELPFGTIDCYQLLLFISHHTEEHLQKIEMLISKADFPKN